jgi:hypothetical protein
MKAKITKHKGVLEEGFIRHQVFINIDSELIAKIFVTIPEKHIDKEEKILNGLEILKHI